MKNIKEKVLSPISGTNNVLLLNQIESKVLIENYRQYYKIDITNLFINTPTVKIYKCLDSGYSFYYPFHIAGDDEFYQHFGKLDWYYLPWKWEHQQCASLVKDGDRVLEVGAGRGDFIAHLSKLKKINAVGLELNSDVVKKANSSGIKLINQPIEDYAKLAPNSYDIVCSFQVLEHITNVGEVIQAMIKCLKPNGTLLVSVPNNDSFIGANVLPSKALNMPPHHMGLWNQNSLENLVKYFPLTIRKILIEPLQPIHASTFHYNFVRKLLFNNNFLVRVYWKLKIYHLSSPFITLFSKKITGHSIIAVYEKNKNN
ncbi:MAG: class I SAM-dependent methyltransferase [Flavobacteriaceae bacterium]|nr:class I SAM-dependent methyltransferase [Flavobacteriaceae bacterium]